MTLKEKLYNAIRDYTSIDYLYKVGEPHKHETVARCLRKLTQEGKIAPDVKKGANVAYTRIYAEKPTQANFKPSHASICPISATDTVVELLNVKILEIMKEMKLSWSSNDDVKILRKALEGKNIILKKGVIEKYNN